MRRQVVINADIHAACGVSDESLKRPSAGSIWRRGGSEYNDSRLTRPDRSTRALRVEQFIIEWVGEHVKRALEPSDAHAGRRELPDGHDGREFASLCPEAQPGEGQSIHILANRSGVANHHGFALAPSMRESWQFAETEECPMSEFA